MDTDAYMHSLLVSHPLREEMLREAINNLAIPPGSRGLDVGCGIGLQTLLLAEGVGPEGHITGLDSCPEFLARAGEIVRDSGLGERISFQQGDMNQLPFDDNSFDWLWSVDCAGYAPGRRPVPLLKELARVVKPAGTVAILVWSSQQILPGYPLLEAHLNATSSGLAPFVKGESPETHFMCALGWFREAGLEERAFKTFAGSARAPFDDDIRQALVSLIQMRWVDVQPELSSDDWEEYQRICKPESEDFILNYPDYCAFFTCSMFRGRVPR
ncbi:MAG: class I SAM-dependent methyltransferase [Dehalococcoidia bacterium]